MATTGGATGKLKQVAAAFSENPGVGLIGHGITEVLAPMAPGATNWSANSPLSH